MRCLDLTLPDAAENLALDEALLEEAEAAAAPMETLRLWELPGPAVVVGRSSRVSAEVHVDVCRQLGIPILRRISGGAAVVAGPGCLMYSLVLSYHRRPALRVLSEAHRDVLGTVVAALSASVAGLEFRGTSDLAMHASRTDPGIAVADCNGREGGGQASAIGAALKFSGNSVRCRRNHLLYHGTLLYAFPLPLIDHCLKMPSRVPEYRAGRAHRVFVTNLPVAAETLRQALISAWNAGTPRVDWPREQTEQLARTKYGRPEWNGLSS
jgi:lipoate-protein ligase A